MILLALVIVTPVSPQWSINVVKSPSRLHVGFRFETVQSVRHILTRKRFIFRPHLPLKLRHMVFSTPSNHFHPTLALSHTNIEHETSVLLAKVSF